MKYELVHRSRPRAARSHRLRRRHASLHRS
jgi:hypothetical protein